MDFLAALLGVLVVQVPVLAVLVIGLAVLGRPGRRLPGRSNTLARAGLIVLLVESAASMVFPLALTQAVIRSGWSTAQFGLFSGILSFMFAVLFAAGIGLLVGAFATVRSEAARLGSLEPGSVGPDR